MRRKNKNVKSETNKIQVWGKNCFVRVRKDAIGFVVDNGMGYLIFKVPAYENWITDDELQDPFKTLAYLDKHEFSEQYKTSGCKLPDGKWELFGKANEIKSQQWDEILAEFDFKPDTTLILKNNQP